MSSAAENDNNDTSNPLEFITLYVCPSIGCILAALMYLSPVADLIKATRTGDAGHLPTLPWAVGLANCWGWVVYGYLEQNLFVMLSNVPGLLLCIYLNHGAIKLQYYALWKEHTTMVSSTNANKESTTATPSTTEYESIGDAAASVSSLLSNKSTDTFLATSGITAQERVLYPILFLWTAVSVYIGWFDHVQTKEAAAATVGVLCNINLMFFYGVPIQILRKVWQSRDASAIHRPTLCMTACNATFWLLYGLEIRNAVIAIPNGLGALLGLAQALTLLVIPTKHTPSAKTVAEEAEAILESFVEQMDEHVYGPLTPRTMAHKSLPVHAPPKVVVPAPFRSAMLV